MATAIGDVPIDQLWYFAPITPDDESGYLWIASILCLVYILSFSSLRLFTNRRSLKLNDWVSLVATFFGILECICLFIAISAGLGRKSSMFTTMDHRRINKAIYATFILFIVAHSVAKVSMALLSRTLFGMYRKKLCLANVCIAAAWGPVALLILLPKWMPACYKTGPFSAACYPAYGRWYALAAIDTISELILFTVPGLSLYPLNMARGTKVGVIFTFATRLLTIVPFFIGAAYIQRTQQGHPSSQLASLAVLQITLALSLITTNASALRSMTRPIKSVLGGSDYNGYRYGDETIQPTLTMNRTMRTNKSHFGSIQVQTQIQMETEIHDASKEEA